jgi:hypothetical protein
MKNNINKVFARFYRVSAKSNLKLTPELIETIIGLIFGDLCSVKPKDKHNPYLSFGQGTAAGHRSLHLTMERPGPGSCSNSLGPNKA